jgi:hypothetical protein
VQMARVQNTALIGQCSHDGGPGVICTVQQNYCVNGQILKHVTALVSGSRNGESCDRYAGTPELEARQRSVSGSRNGESGSKSTGSRILMQLART